jgi:hypothetical protein
MAPRASETASQTQTPTTTATPKPPPSRDNALEEYRDIMKTATDDKKKLEVQARAVDQWDMHSTMQGDLPSGRNAREKRNQIMRLYAEEAKKEIGGMGDSQDPVKIIAEKMPRLDSDDPAVVRGMQLLQGAYIWEGWQKTLPERFGRPETLNDVADAVREARKRVKSPQSPQPKKSDTSGFENLVSWLTKAWRFENQYTIKAAVTIASQERPEIFCEECSTYNQPDSKFCSQCGAELKPKTTGPTLEGKLPMTCAACGKENPPGDRYCNNCGKELG